MRLLVEASALLIPASGIREYIVNYVAALCDAEPSLELAFQVACSREELALLRRDFPRAEFPRPLVLPDALGRYRERISFVLGGLAAGRGDVFWGPNFFLPLFPGGRRTIVTIHDLAYLLFPQFYPVKSRSFEWKIASSIGRADVVLAVSEATKRDLLGRFSVPGEKVRVLPNILPPSMFQEAPAEEIARVRERLGIPGRYLLSVGTLQPRKNFANLIRAFTSLAGALPDDLFLVLGGARGWMDEEILKAREDSPLKERILILGPFRDEDRPALYQGALALVYPSWYEGFGIPLLEALASGIPIASSDSSSLPEVAGDGAIYFRPDDLPAMADAMRRLATDEGARRELVEKGRRRLALFDARKTAQAFLGLLSGA